MAYPEQSPAANQMKYWNWFQPAHQRRGGGEPALIAGITRDILREYAVDAEQVYVAGFSAGGAMAAVMAATYGDLYAAVGVHSGLAYAAAHDVPSAFAVMKNGPTRDVQLPGDAPPLIVFHGDQDQIVDQVNAGQLVRQWRSTAAGFAESGPSTVHGPPVRGCRSYTRLVYPQGAGTPATEQWVIHGGGHAWSGGDAQRALGPTRPRCVRRDDALLHAEPHVILVSSLQGATTAIRPMGGSIFDMLPALKGGCCAGTRERPGPGGSRPRRPEG